MRVRDVLDALLEGKEIHIFELKQEPVFVTQRKKLPAVLEDIQKSREHMAIVEESKTSHVFVGIVTLEDVLEELVGKSMMNMILCLTMLWKLTIIPLRLMVPYHS